MSGHTATPGPWRTSIDEEADELYIIGPCGRDIAEMIRGLDAKDDAALIIDSRNSHADLVKALEDARRDLLLLKSRSDTGSLRNRQIDTAAERIRAALATLTARKVG